MKRLVRSALDPLPGSLSTRSLAILVTMFVGGIGISVHEYLESGRVHAADRRARPVAEDGAAPSTCRRKVSEPSGPAFRIGSEPVRRTATCDAPDELDQGPASAPGVWIPEPPSTGS